MFALADQAFAIAGNLGPEYQVAISASINYVRPGRRLSEAKAILVCETKSTSLYQVEVFQGEEMIVRSRGWATNCANERSDARRTHNSLLPLPSMSPHHGTSLFQKAHDPIASKVMVRPKSTIADTPGSPVMVATSP